MFKPGIISSQVIAAVAGNVQLEVVGDTDTVFDPSPAAVAGFQFETDGNVIKLSGDAYSFPWWTEYPVTDIGDDYEIRATLNSGDAPSGNTLNTWHPLTSNVLWSLNQSSEGVKLCELEIQIRDAATMTLQDTGTYTINAIYIVL